MGAGKVWTPYLDENNNRVFYSPGSNSFNLHTTYYNALSDTATSLSVEPHEDGESRSVSTKDVPYESFLGSIRPETSLEKLVGLTSSEVSRFKEKLLNKHLDELDNEVITPTEPTTSPFLSQMMLSNSMGKSRETREILMAHATSEYMKTDIQIRLKELELKQSELSMREASLILQADELAATQRLTNATERVNMNLGELRGSLASMNTKLKSVSDYYDFQKEGTTDLKDSNGKQISPREAQAKNNAEQHIYKDAQNTFNHYETGKTLFEDLEKMFKGTGTGANSGNAENCKYPDDETGLLKLLCSLTSFDLDKFASDKNFNIFKESQK